MSDLGIPYARVEVAPLGLVRVCPACGERIPESSDDDGERTTNAYGAHYAEFHK